MGIVGGVVVLSMMASPSAPSAARLVPTSVSIEPTWTEARAALRDGDGLRALASLGDDAPVGLRIRALLASKRPQEACAVDAGRSVAGQFHRARCLSLGAMSSWSNAEAMRLETLTLMRQAPALFVADEARVETTISLMRGASASQRDVMAAALVERPAPSFDRPARARLARVLTFIVDESPAWRRRAATRLVLELPEHARVEDRDVVGPLDAAARVQLATTLERQHENDRVVDVLAELARTDCDAALLVGKSERKRKRFAAARSALKVATAPKCADDLQKKAAFLEVRLAAVSKGAAAEPLAQAFIRRFGKDPLVDDVWLWLAEVRSARGDDDAALDALSTLVNEHPHGDMVNEARFRLAMLLAARGSIPDARSLLEQTVQQGSEGTSVIDHDRARYWSARLLAAPSLTSLNAGADGGRGVEALRVFAAERPASYYGRMAALVSAHLVERAPLRAAGTHVAPPPSGAPAGGRSVDGVLSARSQPVSVAVPAQLLENATFVDALAAAADGFDDDAAVLLGDVALGRGSVDVAMAVAAAFSSVGRSELGHRAMRDRGFAMLPGNPADPGRLLPFTLGWPRASAAELDAAATAHGVPPLLLSALAREESAFDASVVSWAGAVGLCQLMPTTAADEARLLKLPAPTPDRLADPAYNASLGAAHLGRRLRGLGHPFRAIAAYNAGPGAVLKWVPTDGARLPIDLWVEQIPFEETRNYVKKVTNSWVTYSALADVPLPAFELFVP